MYRHVVMYKLIDNSMDNKQKLVDVFNSMNGQIPEIVSLNASFDKLCSPRSYDVILDVVFNNKEDMKTYRDSKYHLQHVMPYVHSVITESHSIDYDY